MLVKQSHYLLDRDLTPLDYETMDFWLQIRDAEVERIKNVCAYFERVVFKKNEEHSQ